MRVDPQQSLYETTIESPELEAALEERETLKTVAAQARKTFKECDDRAKGLVETLELGNGAPVRVGRFVLERREVAARSVAFDTDPTTRLTIRLLELES